MSVTFFIGEQRLKTKIGLASICLLGLATSHVAANETEVAKLRRIQRQLQVVQSKISLLIKRKRAQKYRLMLLPTGMGIIM